MAQQELVQCDQRHRETEQNRTERFEAAALCDAADHPRNERLSAGRRRRSGSRHRWPSWAPPKRAGVVAISSGKTGPVAKPITSRPIGALIGNGSNATSAAPARIATSAVRVSASIGKRFATTPKTTRPAVSAAQKSVDQVPAAATETPRVWVRKLYPHAPAECSIPTARKNAAMPNRPPGIRSVARFDASFAAGVVAWLAAVGPGGSRRDEAQRERELPDRDDRVAALPRMAGEQHGGHQRGSDRGADSVAGVHPVERARAVMRRDVGVERRVEQARSDAREEPESHHHRPGWRERVAEQASRGGEAAGGEQRTEMAAREQSPARETREDVARGGGDEQRPERVEFESEARADRRPRDAEQAVGQTRLMKPRYESPSSSPTRRCDGCDVTKLPCGVRDDAGGIVRSRGGGLAGPSACNSARICVAVRVEPSGSSRAAQQVAEARRAQVRSRRSRGASRCHSWNAIRTGCRCRCSS